MLSNMGSLIFRALGASLVIAFAASAGGCGASYADSCKPGKMVACKCAGGAAGSRACTDSDDSACECGGASASDVGDTGFGDPTGEDTSTDPPNTTDPPTDKDAGTPPVDEDAGTTPDPTSDGGTAVVDVPRDPEAAAPSCTKLENRGKRIVASNVMDDMPKALGGTITPGIYVQTWVVHYRGLDGARPEKLVRSTETLEILEDGTGRVTVKDNDKAETNAGIVFSTTGSNVVVEPVCPQGRAMSYSYTATARQLIIYDAPWARVLELQEKAAPATEEETPAPEEGQ